MTMRLTKSLFAVLLGLLSTVAVCGQSPDGNRDVPRLIRYSGVVANRDGAPRNGVIGVMFSLYAEQAGGTALWTELQNVQPDANGRYTVLLGSQHSDGVPAELFTSNEARWLGVQVEADPEGPRTLLVSVPYALKAKDAETLGGRPWTDFALSPEASGTTASPNGATTGAAGAVQPYTVNTSASGGTAGYLARWADASTLGNSVLYDNGTNVGIGMTSPVQKLVVANPGGGPTLNVTNLIDQDFVFTISAPGASDKVSLIGTSTPTSIGIAVAGDSKVRVTNSGNVGIGYFNPAQRLVVAQVSGGTVMNVTNLQDQDFLVNLTAPGSGDRRTWIGPGVNTSLALGVAGNEFMRITNSGNIGVGTAAPGQKLSVVGTVESTSGGFKFPDGTVQLSSATSGNSGVTAVLAGSGIAVTGPATSPTVAVDGTVARTFTNNVGSTSDQVFHVTQNGPGASSLAIDTLPTAIRGDSTTTANYSSGLLGVSLSPSGFGVVGGNSASSGYAIGVFGDSTQSPAGTGVWGQAEAATGDSVGVYGTSSSSAGTGLWGFASSATGDTVGVYGRSASDTGTGVWGDAPSSTGVTFAVYGSVASSLGTAGVFDNTSGSGNLVLGRSGSNHTNMFRVDSTGKGFFNGGTQASGADFAESVDVAGSFSAYKPGDLLIIDSTGYRRVALSDGPYSTKVAGIYSTKPGLLATPHAMDDPRLAGEVPLAVVGIVPCKVSAENGPISPGDMLVSSSTPGYAMKGTDRSRMLGAVVGKAMQSMNSGFGVIEVLVSLH